MKIILMVPEMELGGVEECTFDLALGLTERKHEVFLLTRGGRKVLQLQKAGVRFCALPLHRKDPFSFIFSVFRTKELLRSLKPDIVHAGSRVPAWVGYLATRRTARTHFVTTFHSFYNRHLPSTIMARGSRVIAVSRSLAEYAVRHFGVAADRVRVVYNGVRMGEVNRPAIPDKVRLGTLIRLSAGKGLELFLDIVRQMKKIRPDVVGVLGVGVAGRDSRSLAGLKRLIRAGGLEDTVTILGNPDRETFYGRTDIYLGCSTRPEGFGRVLVEAQLCGIPVVASGLGAACEVIRNGQTGFLVAPKTESFLPPLKKLMENPGLRNTMGNCGRQWVLEKFSVHRMVEETLSVYQELVQSH